MSILGAVGSIAGGIGGYFAQKSANKAAAKEARKAREHEINILKNQVGWRVTDAMKAGLHPLAALGLNPASSGTGAAQVFGPQDYASLGADVGRALESATTPDEKVATRATQLLFEKQQLENEYTKTQVASQRMRNAQTAAPARPAVDTALNGSISNPDGVRIPFTDITVPFADKGIAQKVEDSWGELSGELYGMGSSMESYARYMNLERMLTGDDITPLILGAHRAMSTDTAKGGYKSRHLAK